MQITKKCYVFYLIFLLSLVLGTEGLAQKTQKGDASWYGSKYHGRKTSSGEIYNKNQLTAAHRTLPFGTKVKVTNLKNKKSVIVRINDRGPFKPGRVIDVSEAAARKIGMVSQGLAPVKVEVLGNTKTQTASKPAPKATAKTYYALQTGSFSSAANAQKQSKQVKAIANAPVKLVSDKVNGKPVHRVMAGQYSNRRDAERMKQKLAKKGVDSIVKEVS